MKAIYKKLFELKKVGISLKRDTKAYNYKYATLDQIQEKINPELEKLQLLVSHYVKDENVITQIIDTESGEFIESSIKTNTTKPQDKGSEITYFRRYNLVCLLDLEVEDDDGKKAQDSKEVFGKKEYDALVKNKGNYIDARAVLAILDDKGYTVSKEYENKITDLYK